MAHLKNLPIKMTIFDAVFFNWTTLFLLIFVPFDNLIQYRLWTTRDWIQTRIIRV